MKKNLFSGLFLFLLAATAAGQAAGAVALYPAAPADNPLAGESDRWLAWGLERAYRLYTPAEFEPLLAAESELRADLELPPEAFYPVLATRPGIRYVVTPRLEPADGGWLFRVFIFDTVTSRAGRITETPVDEQTQARVFRRAALEVRNILLFRDRSGVAGAVGDPSEALKQIVGRRPAPTLTVAFLEEVSGQPPARPLTEILFRRYLKSAGFPFRDGEAHLLRTYARSHFGEGRWSFPRTLVSEYYLIGRTRVDEGADYHGMPGAEAHLEVKILDRRGRVIGQREITTGAYGLSFDEAAVTRAINTAVVEMCFLIVPELRYDRR